MMHRLLTSVGRLADHQGGPHGQPAPTTPDGFASVVPPAPAALHRPALAAVLRQGDPAAGGLPLLLLVPVPLGAARRRNHRARLPAHHAASEPNADRRRGTRPAGGGRRALNAGALSVFVFFFLLVTVLGFIAARR